MTDKPMTVDDWEYSIESLIKEIQNLELKCNMNDTFQAGTVNGCQYARSRLTTLVEISKGKVKVIRKNND